MWDIFIFIFIFSLIILFLLARSFGKNFFRFWYLITTSKSWAMRLSSVFLLPGTLVHELSHWLVAELLQVPTGSMNLMPTMTDDGGIKLGSVEIAKTDVFRKTLIGLAPLVTGLLLIGLSVQFLPEEPWTCSQSSCWWLTGLVVMVIFLISNSMFSSKKDMEAAFVPFALVLILVAAFWWFELKLPESVVGFSHTVINKMNAAFLITITINIGFLLLVKILTAIFEKILRRRIVNV